LYLFIPIVLGCDSKKEGAAIAGKPVIAPGPGVSAPLAAESTAKQASSPDTTNAKADVTGIAVEVDGEKMTRAQLDQDIQKRLETLKGQIPAENLESAQAEIRRAVIDEFIIRTLLNREVSRSKQTARKGKRSHGCDEGPVARRDDTGGTKKTKSTHRRCVKKSS
jgi:peptidyl-prolyl cis-trans isomerase C